MYNNVDIFDSEILSISTKKSLMQLGLTDLDLLSDYLQIHPKLLIDGLSKKTRNEILTFAETNQLQNQKKITNMLIEEILDIEKHPFFLKFCHQQGFIFIKQLAGFDFNTLLQYKGFGYGKVEKIRSILEKYITSLPSSKIEAAKLLHPDNLTLPITLLKSMGLKKQYMLELNKLSISTLEELSNISFLQVEPYFSINQWKKITYILCLFEKSLLELITTALQKLNPRSKKIYLLRAEGESLEKIGNQLNLTRERVRQIESKIMNQFEPILIHYSNQLRNNKNYIRQEDIQEKITLPEFLLFCNHTLKNSQQIEYLDFAEIYYYKSNFKDEIRNQIITAMQEILIRGFRFTQKKDEIINYFLDQGFDFIDESTLINLIEKSGGYFYKDYVCSQKQSYGYLCAQYIREHFPQGLNIYNEQNLQLLRKMIHQEYGITLPEENRAVSARIYDFLILSGRGIYTHEDNLCYDSVLIERIKSFIDMSNQDQLYYHELFAQFEQELRQMGNIKDCYALHGILVYLYPDSYHYKRDFLTKQGASFTLSFTDRLINLITQTGQAMSRSEIKTSLKGFSDVMILNAVTQSPLLMQWGFNHYNCNKNIYFNENEKNYLHHIILQLLNSNNGYCNEYMIYNQIQSFLPILHRNKITNSTHLFYTLQNLFGSLYTFHKPHIGNIDQFPTLNTQDILLQLMNNPIEFNYETFNKLTKKLYLPEITISTVLIEIEKEHPRIAVNHYLHKSQIIIDMNQIIQIQQQLNKLVGPLGIAGLQKIDLNQLPKIRWSWNTYLLTALVKQLDLGYYIISAKITDRRYQRDILVRNDLHLERLDQFVIMIMKQQQKSILSTKQMRYLLTENGLPVQDVPKEIIESPYFHHSNGFFEINPDNAQAPVLEDSAFQL